MSEPENFLTRWSRRKAAPSEQDQQEQDAAATAAPEAEASTNASEEKRSDAAAAEAQKDPPAPAFDLATLPAIESIGAGTDISAFLKAGVPAEMARAALRRAWATDPTIRDFIGLAENSWDFTAPNSILGFGPLSAEDASRAMAQLTSSAKEVAGKAKEAIERISQFDPPAESVQAKLPPGESSQRSGGRESASQQTASPTQDEVEQNRAANAEPSNSLQRGEENIATQYNRTESNDSHPTRRAHGSALPE